METASEAHIGERYMRVWLSKVYRVYKASREASDRGRREALAEKETLLSKRSFIIPYLSVY